MRHTYRSRIVPWLACLFAYPVAHADTAGFVPDPDLVERGLYVTRVSGCHDCHTPGYLLNDGQAPAATGLIGDAFGWRGPWGTTYAANLRLFIGSLTEEQWVEAARTLKRRPPMPWFNVNLMQEQDLRAIYHFVKSLGDPGEPAPAYVPPGEEPSPPYATFPAPPKD